MGTQRKVLKSAPLNLRSKNAGVTNVGFWRIYEIHRLISAGTYPNCPRIARKLEVSHRTAERDISRLRDFFYSIGA